MTQVFSDLDLIEDGETFDEIWHNAKYFAKHFLSSDFNDPHIETYDCMYNYVEDLVK